MRRRPTRHTRTAVLASAVAAVVSHLPLTGTTAAADTNTPVAPAHGGTALFAEPDKALGDGWEDSFDIAVQGVGDSAGFHIMAAKESDGFAFKEVARLTRKGLDVGPWTGYACVTGSGRYAAAVYAPSLSNNDPEAVAHGAYAAVVRGKFSMQFGDNITTGRADGTVRATPYIAQIDVHQLGAGYDGHSFFTHSYPTGDFFHKVTARWEPDPAKLPPSDQPGGQEMDVWVHLPNHGAEGIVKYSLVPGMNNDGAVTHSCRLNQKTRSNGDDVWIELGSQPFWKGGRVEADNEHDSGTGDTNVAFDAVAFTYTVVPEPGVCGFG